MRFNELDALLLMRHCLDILDLDFGLKFLTARMQSFPYALSSAGVYHSYHLYLMQMFILS